MKKQNTRQYDGQARVELGTKAEQQHPTRAMRSLVESLEERDEAELLELAAGAGGRNANTRLEHKKALGPGHWRQWARNLSQH